MIKTDTIVATINNNNSVSALERRAVAANRGGDEEGGREGKYSFLVKSSPQNMSL